MEQLRSFPGAEKLTTVRFLAPGEWWVDLVVNEQFALHLVLLVEFKAADGQYAFRACSCDCDFHTGRTVILSWGVRKTRHAIGVPRLFEQAGGLVSTAGVPHEVVEFFEQPTQRR